MASRLSPSIKVVMDISVVIPVFRNESYLNELYSRLVVSLEEITDSFEIIMVEDCGGDCSWEIIEELSEKDKRVNGIQLSRNYGQHNALLCGIRAARHDVVVTMDGDLQHPPEEIPKLLSKLAEGHDVVYGTPEKEQHGFWRDTASWVTKLALRYTMGAETARHISAFRAFRTHVRNAFAHYQSPFISIDVLLTWGTTRFAAVPVHRDSRKTGVSGYTFGKLIIHTLNMMTGFSTVPLRLASWTGFTFMFFGLGVLVYVVGRYLIEGGSVPGFPFLASLIAIFSGAQLFALGIIGEYLARMYYRSIDRPVYIVRSSTLES